MMDSQLHYTIKTYLRQIDFLHFLRPGSEMLLLLNRAEHDIKENHSLTILLLIDLSMDRYD